MKLSKRANISKYANVIYVPPHVIDKATLDLKNHLKKMVSAVERKGFDFLYKNYNNKIFSKISIDFEDFPKQYEKFIGPVLGFYILFNFDVEDKRGFYDLGKIVIQLPEEAFTETGFVGNNLVSFLMPLCFPILKHEIIHAIQDGMETSWMEKQWARPSSERILPPKQFKTRDYDYFKEAFNPDPLSAGSTDYEDGGEEEDYDFFDYAIGPIEMDPYVDYLANEFVRLHDVPFSNPKIMKFIKEKHFFQELEKEDKGNYNIALKKFYKLIFDGLSPEQKQNLMKKSKLSLRHFSK